MSWTRALIFDLNLPIAGLTGLGALFAIALARQSHAFAPVCGDAHCPACYVAAGLAVISVWRGALWLRPAR